jgi:polar amino acid transport system ATP-binding protein
MALRDIYLDVECQTLALLGRSGSGKSTLLRIIAGLEFPDRGEVFLDGKKMIFEESALRRHRREVGIVFQSWNLFPHLTALENISLPLHYVHGHSAAEAKELAMQLLSRFHLRDHAHKRPAQLSGGQSQRVAIVRAVIPKPRLILFDEPTSALDPLMTAEVLDLIVELKEEGTDLIIASHHLTFIRKMAECVAFFEEGQLIEKAPVEQFFQHPQSLKAQAFLAKVLKY